MAQLNTRGIGKVTPEGLGLWVKVTEANMFGKLTADLVCNPQDSEVQEFKMIIDNLANAVAQETGKKKVLVPYKEDDEGNLVFKTSAPEFDKKTGDPMLIQVVDWHKKDLTNVNIGNGSKIKLLVYIMPYDQGANTGVSLRLKKVQVLDLVEFGEDFGVEAGFEGSGATTPSKPTNPATEDLQDDEDF